jgi:CubicO group peptidase (beta-lactamase class C family)
LAFLVFTTRTRKSKSLPNRGNGETFAAIDEYVTARMRAARIPGLALGIVKGDRIVYLKGYGRAGPSGRPVTPQTPFIIGSITKSFTALAVLQLVEAGKVELDAPVQRYIPWFRVADPKASAQITVRQLLNQTSGLPQIYETQFWTGQDEGALERVVRFLKKVELNRPVGKGFGYSNANYEVLGLIVQTVSGQTYEETIRQSIFAPWTCRIVSPHRGGYAPRYGLGAPVVVRAPHPGHPALQPRRAPGSASSPAPKIWPTT